MDFEPERPGFTVYTVPVYTGLLFTSPPKRSDFCSAERTGLLWCSVNSSRIRYENRSAPMSISFPEHARSRVSGGQGSGETEFSRTILYGSRMLFNDSNQIVIHIYCGPTKYVS